MSGREWCPAVLRPQGLACTLRAGHPPLDDDGGGWDHVHRPPKLTEQEIRDAMRGSRYSLVFAAPHYFNDPADTADPTPENSPLTRMPPLRGEPVERRVYDLEESNDRLERRATTLEANDVTLTDRDNSLESRILAIEQRLKGHVP